MDKYICPVHSPGGPVGLLCMCAHAHLHFLFCSQKCYSSCGILGIWLRCSFNEGVYIMALPGVNKGQHKGTCDHIMAAFDMHE